MRLFAIPNVLWPIYGFELNDKYSVFLSQQTSIFLAAIAIIGFMLNEIPEKSELAKKLILSLVHTNIIGVIITLYACFSGIFQGFGWSDPAFFAFLTIMSFLQWQNNKSNKFKIEVISVIMYVDFPHKGVFGTELKDQLKELAESINHEPGIIWKIWTENKAEKTAGGVYLFDTRANAEKYLTMHHTSLSQ